MAGKREKPEDIVLKLRQVEVLQGQGKSVSEAVRQIGVTIQTYYWWRKEYGGMSRDQLKRLKELETENQRLKRVVADLSLGKMIPTEAARGIPLTGTLCEASPRGFQALPVAVCALIMCGKPSAYLSAEFSAHSANIALRSARCHVACLMKNG